MLQPLSHSQVVSRDARFQRMARTLAGLRILTGALWLAGLWGRLPPRFGGDGRDSLRHWFAAGARYGAPPLRSLARDVLVVHPTEAGYVLFAIQLCAGLSLLLGVRVRIGALVGSGEALVVVLLLGSAPDAWRWAYVTLLCLNLACLAAPTGLRWSVDALRRRA
jgi:uncharacterized membrane protein YphA (DoxX/SURF4 family)